MNDISNKKKHEFSDLIGSERSHTHTVTKNDIKRFAQAIDDPNPIYRDEEYAIDSHFNSIVAPLLFCQAYAFEDVELEELLPDGSPVEINIPLPADKTVGGGSVFEIFDHVRPGDEIKVTSKITDVYQKQGRSGLLFFVVVETIFYNQNDKMVSKETATFIKR